MRQFLYSEKFDALSTMADHAFGVPPSGVLTSKHRIYDDTPDDELCAWTIDITDKNVLEIRAFVRHTNSVQPLLTNLFTYDCNGTAGRKYATIEPVDPGTAKLFGFLEYIEATTAAMD